MNLKGQRVAILGAGGSGLAAAALALSCGAQVEAFDSGSSDKLSAAAVRFEELGVTLTTGKTALAPSGRFDLTVMSPGIALTWSIARIFSGVSDELVGEIEFAYRANRTPIIAITGTNGKTTTTSLITEMLKGAGLKAVSAGNIGLPFSEVVTSGEDYDWVVLELSSFQLESISTFAAPIAIWLNFAPDHMDRYDTVEAYRSAKERIFINRSSDAVAIVRKGEDVADGWPRIEFSAFDDTADYFYSERKIGQAGSNETFDFSACELQGRHNAENLMVALAVADHLLIDRQSVRSALQSFLPPAHRCEKVGVKNGVVFVNDSKSTNLHSLESALAGQDEPVVLIAGGKEKGLDFSTLSELVKATVKSAVCIGEIASSIADQWSASVPCECAANLELATEMAFAAAGEGGVVIFSPGTSSFDMFSGYEARGDAFRDAVKNL
ncbi:UDP-N-acetylmuramoyl-L-alanine--D-glutamate ligase [Verrucomicrobiales bacterium]|jgi:UDP-N-acetylmuramoylalanine--D-glutamate ligase|nr:UDP-N-acetylmuramoyl-L-alanine--D-glutamate ligase [Verrucomicrobiales bacterium]